MCGICGILDFKNPIDEQLVVRMRDAMIHRGPDDKGIYISQDRRIGLGHRRLSIIDLSEKARQPMSNETHTIWLVCNGEIYNYEELSSELVRNGHKFKSRSDNEVIIHLYEEYGMNLLHKLDGDFAFGLWDDKKKKLYVVRDRMGIKPCFYYHKPNKLIFASEIKAILEDTTVIKDIDVVALHHYLTLLSVPAPYTIYEGIKKIMPGHYIVVDSNETKDIDYWHLDRLYSQDIVYKQEEEFSEEFIYLLRKAIKKRLMSDVPLGVFLSGGVDSSALVASMSEITSSIKTFSVIFGAKYSCDESVYSRQISELFNTEHYECLVRPEIFSKFPEIIGCFDEPFATPSAVPLYFLSRFAGTRIKVALTGDGGDELFAGYSRYNWDHKAEQLNNSGFGSLSKAFSYLLARVPLMDLAPRNFVKAKALIEKLLSSVSMESDRRYLSYFTFLSEDMKNSLYSERTRVKINNADSLDILESNYRKLLNTDALRRRIYGDIMTTLPDEMLAKGDRMAMAHSIENRVPLLDQELVEFSCRLPTSLRLRGNTGKYIIKKAMNGKLPHKLLFRRKQGFNVPLGQWLRGDLAWMLHEYLDHNKIKRQGIFNPQKVSCMLKRFTDENADLEYCLFPLLVLGIWFEQCHIRRK